MKMVVGLGNPGGKYLGTRHNVGFEVLWELGKRWGGGRPKTRFEAEVLEVSVHDNRLLLLAPQTFMNLSGRSVQQAVRFFQLSSDELVVLCDDLNLKPGQLRLRASGSAGGQKGLQSILSCLATEDVPRLRIGIGRPPAGVDSADYVLGQFRSDEQEVMNAAILRAADAVEMWSKEGIAVAMNRANTEVEGGDQHKSASG